MAERGKKGRFITNTKTTSPRVLEESPSGKKPGTAAGLWGRLRGVFLIVTREKKKKRKAEYVINEWREEGLSLACLSPRKKLTEGL